MSDLDLERKILSLLEAEHLSDLQLSNMILGPPILNIIAACRRLEKNNKLQRIKNGNGEIINLLIQVRMPDEHINKDDLKNLLFKHLKKTGWTILFVSEHNKKGIDIIAERDSKKWLIEVKGCTITKGIVLQDFFLMLGKLLFFMKDPSAKYSIAVPEMKNSHKLWDKLPSDAKQRTDISILYGQRNGDFTEAN